MYIGKTMGKSSSYIFVDFPHLILTTENISMTSCDLKVKMHGKTTVGPKSQIVIPKDVRELLDIKPGDDLMIISKGDMAIGMIKSDDVPKFLEYIHSEMKN